MPEVGLRASELTERTIYLRSIPVTAELPTSVLHRIAQALEDVVLGCGRFAQHVGQPATGLYLLRSGKLNLERDGRPAGVLLPPQSIGFLDIIARADASFDAIAGEETSALYLSAERLLQLMEDHFELLSATLAYGAQRLLAEMQDLPEQALGLAAEEVPIPISEQPLDLIERVLAMRCTAVFRKTNVNALAVLAAVMPETRYPAGTVLFEAGAPAPYGVFLVRGTVRCEVPDGRTFRYGASTAVGGVESLAGRPRWYRAIAETDLVTVRGDSDLLLDMMEDNFDLGFDFVSMLANGVRGLVARKLALGQPALAEKREVSGLGKIRVGA